VVILCHVTDYCVLNSTFLYVILLYWNIAVNSNHIPILKRKYSYHHAIRCLYGPHMQAVQWTGADINGELYYKITCLLS